MGCSHRARVILFAVFLTVASSSAQSPPASAPVDAFGPAVAPGPSNDCFNALLTMSDCLTFVENGSKLAKPDKGCCPALSNLVATNPICLCQLLGKNSTVVGIQIDVNKAISLPKLCRVDTPPISLCSAVGVDVSLPPGSEGPTMSGVPPTPSIASNSQHRKDGLSTGSKIGIGVLSGIGLVLLLALLVFFKWFNHSSLSISPLLNKNKSPINIEVFLEKYGCLALQRYKYSEIKKMTNSFKETLGQGGYGRVFKGELRDGRLVAVKQLNESKGDGEDFINEVATIGRTNHVNVVNLVGFCIEGTRRALVYEFMPNGSLERFIYAKKESSTTLPLGWEKLYQIALGIARGLEYLHRGCNTRILHFDIKPHNILLDQNFCPKISDFGLAKLYPSRESVVSTVGARGTVGYIAPELCYKAFGNVSHKSDVYSFGMMMLEMIGGRKNIDATVDNISEIYFPLWIYNHLKRCYEAKGLEEIQAREVFEDEKAKKMILVALWCIQAHPVDRPSMSKVVEMLEGNTYELQMPPNPSVDPRSSSSTSS